MIMKNRTIILITVLTIIISICMATVWKVNKRHEEREILVVEKRIIEGATECFNKGECEGNKVTLNALINKGYAKKEINPITKTYYNLDSYVIKNEEYEFVEVK